MTIFLQSSSSVPRDRTSSRNVMVLVQTYGISRSHLNYLHRRNTASIMLQTSLVRWVTKRNNYWDDCIQEMNVAQSISDILLHPSRLYLESEYDGLSSSSWGIADDDNFLAVVFSHSWPYFESECDGLSSDLRYLMYLQISFETPTSECDGLSSDLWYLQISLELPTSITEMTAFTR